MEFTISLQTFAFRTIKPFLSPYIAANSARYRVKMDNKYQKTQQKAVMALAF